MRYFLAILTLCTALLAAEGDNIDTLIDDIVTAPKAERYEKMNAFKLKMREMNRQQRSEALEALRARMQTENGTVVTMPPEQPGGKEAVMQQQMRQQLKLQQAQPQQPRPRQGQMGR